MDTNNKTTDMANEMVIKKLKDNLSPVLVNEAQNLARQLALIGVELDHTDTKRVAFDDPEYSLDCLAQAFEKIGNQELNNTLAKLKAERLQFEKLYSRLIAAQLDHAHLQSSTQLPDFDVDKCKESLENIDSLQKEWDKLVKLGADGCIQREQRMKKQVLLSKQLTEKLSALKLEIGPLESVEPTMEGVDEKIAQLSRKRRATIYNFSSLA